MSIWKWNKAGLFVGGMLFATKGIELLKTPIARKAYVEVAALGLRLRDEVMENVTAVRESCEDIYAEALDLKEEREKTSKAEIKVIEDKSKTKAEAKPAARQAASGGAEKKSAAKTKTNKK